jgi:hypothetical protein
VLIGKSTIYKHPKAGTLYITIPAKIATDSQFTFKKGDKVHIAYVPTKGNESLFITRAEEPCLESPKSKLTSSKE